MVPTSSHAKRASVWTLSSLTGLDEVKLLVGSDQREFYIARKPLASSCDFFRERINRARMQKVDGRVHLVISLESVCPDMFRLFSRWIAHQYQSHYHYQCQQQQQQRKRPSSNSSNNNSFFADLIERASSSDDPTMQMTLHWELVNLHLFAARVKIPELQDLAMDSIQDLYLQCNWDLKPKLVRYVYSSSTPSSGKEGEEEEEKTPSFTMQDASRLRRWIVAMTAWTLSGVSGQHTRMSFRIQQLFDLLPGFREDYEGHVRSVGSCGLRFPFELKNPQLRLPSNRYLNEERQFGYRECSFHSHRSSIGQGTCPNRFAAARTPTTPSSSSSSMVFKFPSSSSDASPPPPPHCFSPYSYSSSSSSSSSTRISDLSSESGLSAFSASTYGSLLDDIILESEECEENPKGWVNG